MENMNSNTLLIVEDDPVLGHSLSITLELEGYEIKLVTSIDEAKNYLSENSPMLAIFDLNLPDGHGLDLCRYCQQENYGFPIVILTAVDDEEVVVRCLEAGARDYVRKPFSTKELTARIRSILRLAPGADEKIRVGELIIDKSERAASFKGVDLGLNRRQFDILAYLGSHNGRIVTRDMLLTHLGREGEIYDRTIDSHISQLRRALKKLEECNISIASIYGVGYRFEVAA